ncbi:hypothetical protein L7F22_061678 [Adiantum nelumboides]|nr:hypothetical protein [Adiantum nelumboides]
MVAKERLSIESDACMVYLGGLISAKASWDGSKIWGYFWDILHATCPNLFGGKNPDKICNKVQFMRLFAKDKLLSAITIVLDEADTLFNLSPTCINEFLHVIRLMKYAPQYDKRVKDALGSEQDYQPRSTPSRLSPFPHDHVLSSTKFSLEDVQSLLNQAAADRPDVLIEVVAITGTYIFGQATYNKIIQYVRENADNHEVYNMFVKILQEGEFECEHQTVVKLRDFIAQGVLVAIEQPLLLPSPIARIPPLPTPKNRAANVINLDAKKCRKCKDLDGAKHIYLQMRNNGLETHPILGNYMVPMFVECGSTVNALEVFEKLACRNVFSYNYLILGYVHSEQPDTALTLYDRMKKEGVQPGSYTLVAVLKACTRLQHLNKGQQIHNEVVQKGFENDLLIGST